MAFGPRGEHELEIKRLNVQESRDKHVRNLTLKAVVHKKCQDSSDDSEGETLSLLTRKFNKFLKKNNKNQFSNRYNSKKFNDFNPNKYICFGCGEHGHIKANFPNNESKERTTSKKGEKKAKLRKPTLLEKIMKFLHLVHLQEVKKLTSA